MQEGNSNARKGEVNRKRATYRLPPDIIKYIKDEAIRLEMSQPDFLMLVIRFYKGGDAPT